MKKAVSIILATLLVFASFHTAVFAQTSNETFDWQNSSLPDYSYAGYMSGQQGIPYGEVPEGWITVDVDSCPGNTDLEKIQNAINSVPEDTGAVILFAPRNYDINTASDTLHDISIERDNIILRGQKISMTERTTITVQGNPGKKNAGAVRIGNGYREGSVTMEPKPDREMYIKCQGTKGSRELSVKVDIDSQWRYKAFLEYYDKKAFEVEDLEYIIIRESSELGPTDEEDDTAQKKEKMVFGELGTQEAVDFYGSADAVWLGGMTFYFSEQHKVQEIIQNPENSWEYTFILAEPLNSNFVCDNTYFSPLNRYQNIGIEDITFLGGFTEKFQHDVCVEEGYGWHGIEMYYAINSWIAGCTFVNFNIPVYASNSAFCTFTDMVVKGNQGHHSVIIRDWCTDMLVMNLVDFSNSYHGPSVTAGASGTVFLNVEYSPESCFDLHAAYPYATLFDNLSGGFVSEKNGGDNTNRPHHLTDLTVWNCENTGSAVSFDTWSTAGGKADKTYILPSFIGLSGGSVTFDNPARKLKYYETSVQTENGKPSSLYLMQLRARLGTLPAWAQAEYDVYTEKLYNEKIEVYNKDFEAIAQNSTHIVDKNSDSSIVFNGLPYDVSVRFSNDMAKSSYTAYDDNGFKRLVFTADHDGTTDVTLTAGSQQFTFKLKFENFSPERVKFWLDSAHTRELPLIYNATTISSLKVYYTTTEDVELKRGDDNVSGYSYSGYITVSVSKADTLTYVYARNSSGETVGVQYFYRPVSTGEKYPSISFDSTCYDIRPETPTSLAANVFPPLALVDYTSSDYTVLDVDLSGVATGVKNTGAQIFATLGDTTVSADVITCYDVGLSPDNVIDYSNAGYMAGAEGIPTSTAGRRIINVDSCAGSTDMEKIQNAINQAAALPGGAVVQLSARTYHICTAQDTLDSLKITGDNIVLQGVASNGLKRTTVCVDNTNGTSTEFARAAIEINTTAKRPYTPMYLVAEGSKGSNKLYITDNNGYIASYISRNNKTAIEASDIPNIFVKQTIAGADIASKKRLIFGSNTSDTRADTLNFTACAGTSAWYQDEYHDVIDIETLGGGQYVFTLAEPLNTNFFNNAEAATVSQYSFVGLRDLIIKGAWGGKALAQYYSGWQAISMQNCRDSYISNVDFESFITPIVLENCFRTTVIDVDITGGTARYGVLVRSFSTNCLVANINDKSKSTSGPSVMRGANGTVFFNYKYYSEGAVGLRGTAPYATLMDNVSGGMVKKSMVIGPGSVPSHLGDLTLYNTTNTGAASALDTWYIVGGDSSITAVLPNVIGLNGSPVSFDQSKLNTYCEEAEDDSLYLTQLEERMGELPEWTEPLEITIKYFPFKRLAGGSRVQTSLKIADEGWGVEGTDTAIIANAYGFADALAGGPLSYAMNAPIILTANQNTIEAQTLQQFEALGVEHVVILGGAGAVNENIEAQLQSLGYSTERVAGQSRYETAIAIADKLYEVNGHYSDKDFVACGTNYPDALAVSSVASIMGAPIIFSPTNGSVAACNADYIKRSGTSDVTILGGVFAVGEAAEDNYRALGVANVNRIFGASRYATAFAIVDAFDSVFTSQDVAFATGTSFPDALAGGAFAAKKGIPVILVANTNGPDGLLDYVSNKDYNFMYIFGGEGAVSEDTITHFLFKLF
ncbi:MAG: DUF4955 domain-containing protein [Clostridia bacterium]|nr:DUF4955 domain-containing protein [Clostridia bacterium]